MLTVDGVRRRVEAIASIADDYEAAHGLEDLLYREVLWEIGNDPEMSGHQAGELAREALKAVDLSFARYCA